MTNFGTYGETDEKSRFCIDYSCLAVGWLPLQADPTPTLIPPTPDTPVLPEAANDQPRTRVSP
ncbi:MAG: hypothetical protein H6668_24415 [Ardenticatenaceae bacterium]|nr:hypothetical protein [Ardenticatenaceae bacterium]